MLSYERAQALIRRSLPAPRLGQVALEAALGLTSAQAVRAPRALPGFDNAAVDGYAFRVGREGTPGSSTLRLIGCAEAGRPFAGRVRAGEAVRILTGARIPAGADAVVMQEDVAVSGEFVRLPAWPAPGKHIRRLGEDVRRGSLVLRRGTRLRAQELSLLAALGLTQAAVRLPPRVAVLTTGDELRRPGTPLAPGQIYDSNRILLTSLIRQAQAVPRPLERAPDDMEALVCMIRQGLASSEVLVIAGGVSVGTRDCVRPALARCGVRELFWKVNIKPGMPVFFGRRGRRLVFGLPGNPVSVFVTFEEFVRPVLAALLGQAWPDAYDTPARLAHPVRLSPRRRLHFVRVRQVLERGGRSAVPLQAQGSHHLRSLVEANGWIRLPVTEGPWTAGRVVQVKVTA